MKNPKEAWNKRYREGNHHTLEKPSQLLKRWISQIPDGRAIDIGCGNGRNAIFLSSEGYKVDAIDFSEEALKIARAKAKERNLEINWMKKNVQEHTFPKNRYQLVIISFFNPLEKLAEIKDSVAEGGYILLEHHVKTDRDNIKGPKNDSKFRFEPNELLEKFSDLQILFYEEGIERFGKGKKSAISRIVAKNSNNFEKDLPEIGEHRKEI